MLNSSEYFDFIFQLCCKLLQTYIIKLYTETNNFHDYASKQFLKHMKISYNNISKQNKPSLLAPESKYFAIRKWQPKNIPIQH